MKLVHSNVDEEGFWVWLHGIHKIPLLAMTEFIPTNTDNMSLNRLSRSHNPI
jgi:hypothetical protein